MKTTVDLPESLLNRARQIASRRGTTIDVLIEESLLRLVAELERAKSVRLEHVTFGGYGLSPELKGATWSEILDESHGMPKP